MAKMRGIKPETFTDSKIVRVTPLARYLFIGLWTQACDNGHVAHDEVEIKIRLLPADNADVNELLGELENVGLVELSAEYITIPNLSKHQKLDKRWFKTCDKHDCHTPGEERENTETRGQHGGDTAGPRRGHDESTVGPRAELKGSELKGTENEMKRRESSPKRAQYTDEFENLWKHYPRKDDKLDSSKAWERAKTKEDPKIIKDALWEHIQGWELEGRKKNFIPILATWFNKERWNNEPPQAEKAEHIDPYRHLGVASA